MQPGRIYLLLPAYNPGSGIIRLVESAGAHVSQIVIVDDGCNGTERRHVQRCSAVAKVTLLVHDTNKGKGVALHTGVRHCLDRMDERDFILTMDSDGQHDPDDIPKFRSLLAKEEDVHLVLGERFEDSSMPFKSRIGNSFMRLLFRAQFGGRVHDTQTGFRLLSAPFARHFVSAVRPGRYETEMDMLILASRTLTRVHSVPIRTIYFGNNSGSKFRPIIDSYVIIKLFVSYGAVSIASFGFDYLIFVVLTWLLGVPYLASNALARFGSAIFNFLGHREFSFKSRGRLTTQAVRYVLAVLAALSAATVLLYLFVAGLGVSEYIAKPLVDVLVFCVNFFVLRRFVFRDPTLPHTSCFVLGLRQRTRERPLRTGRRPR